jgi:type II secretory pathway pseudopilin PulG
MSAQRRRRGYLLIEAAVGGALLSVVLASTLSLLADARVQGSYAARRTMAIRLARTKMDEFVGAPDLAAVTPATQTITAVDAIDYPGIKWEWAITDSTSTYAALSPQGLGATQVFDLTVKVTYPTSTGTSTFTLEQLRSQ